MACKSGRRPSSKGAAAGAPPPPPDRPAPAATTPLRPPGDSTPPPAPRDRYACRRDKAGPLGEGIADRRVAVRQGVPDLRHGEGENIGAHAPPQVQRQDP